MLETLDHIGEWVWLMPEPVTQQQFFLAMQQLDDKLQDYHRRQREHIDRAVASAASDLKQQTATILEKFEDHEVADRVVADRVLKIETERDLEKTTAAKHGAIAGSIVGGLTVTVIETVKRLFH